MKSKMPKPEATKDVGKQMLDRFASGNMRSDAERELPDEPKVGIFFVYDRKPFIESTPVSEGAPYGSFTGHDTGHPSFWRSLQQNGVVPKDIDYDEVPRGRVGYETRERKFYVFVDACIKNDTDMMDRIEREMNLPTADTAPPKLDSHYRCPCCLKTAKQREQEEQDWDF